MPILAHLRASSALAARHVLASNVKRVKAVKADVKAPQPPQNKRWRGSPADVKCVKADPRVCMCVHMRPRAGAGVYARAPRLHILHIQKRMSVGAALRGEG